MRLLRNGTQFPCFWIIPMALRRFEMSCWVTLNDSANSYCVWHKSPASNASNLESSKIFFSTATTVLDIKITALEAWNSLTTRFFTKSGLTVSTWQHLMSLSHSFFQIKAESVENKFMMQTQIPNVVLSVCWQLSKFTLWDFWSAYFDQHLPLQPSIEKLMSLLPVTNLHIWKL